MPNPTAHANNRDEAMLVAAVVRGDMNSFRTLIHAYEKLVISIVCRMVTQKEDTEDLCQDVFLKVYEKLPAFRFQSKLSTWIGSIAFNTAVNFLQKRRPVLLDDLQQSRDEDGDPETDQLLQGTEPAASEKLESKEKSALLAEAIERLTVIQKTILQLFHQNELSLQEIADITTLPVSTVKSHLFRARKQLKKLLETY